MVTKTMTVRRRRGLDISFASHPWNWYVTAVTARMNAASSGNPRSIANRPARHLPEEQPDHRRDEHDRASGLNSELR